VLAIAKMLSKSQVAAFFCSTKTGAWLTMESFHLWVEHGPSPALMATLCSTPMQLIAIGEDYQGAHVLGQHLIRVGEKRGYEPATSVARFMYAFCCSHWFAPLEHSLPMYRKARGGLFQGGDLQYGVFTYAGWLPQFDTAASMLMCLDEIEGADAVCQRTGDKNFVQLHRPSLQLVKSLQGKMAAHLPPGSLQDDTFDEAAYEATVQEASTTSAYYDVTRSLLAAIFNQVPDLHRYTQRAMARSTACRATTCGRACIRCGSCPWGSSCAKPVHCCPRPMRPMPRRLSTPSTRPSRHCWPSWTSASSGWPAAPKMRP
jgi:hypothetical protein